MDLNKVENYCNRFFNKVSNKKIKKQELIGFMNVYRGCIFYKYATIDKKVHYDRLFNSLKKGEEYDIPKL